MNVLLTDFTSCKGIIMFLPSTTPAGDKYGAVGDNMDQLLLCTKINRLSVR